MDPEEVVQSERKKLLVRKKRWVEREDERNEPIGDLRGERTRRGQLEIRKKLRSWQKLTVGQRRPSGMFTLSLKS